MLFKPPRDQWVNDPGPLSIDQVREAWPYEGLLENMITLTHPTLDDIFKCIFINEKNVFDSNFTEFSSLAAHYLKQC